MTKKELDALRTAVADYMRSEGCSCCQDREAHKKHRARLGELLNVGSEDGWHDFTPFRSESREGA